MAHVLQQVTNRDQQDAFRFLDLPKDLRLMVYDCLIDRTTVRISDQTLELPRDRCEIVLVTANPIPPIHLTCKFLCEETVPFLKAKVMHMSTPHFIPRIIVHAETSTEHLYLRNAIIQVLLLTVEQLCLYKRKKMDFKSQELINANVHHFRKSQTKDFNDKLLAFATSAAYRIHKAVDFWAPPSWWAEAPGRDDSNHQLKGLDIETLIDRVASSPDFRAKGLHVMVSGDHERFGIQLFLEWLARLCSRFGVRAFVHGVEETHGDIIFNNGWIRYEGVMSDKTWREEWTQATMTAPRAS